MEESIEIGVWREIMGKDIMIKTLEKGTGEIAEMGTVITCNLKGFLVREDGEPESTPFETLQDQQFKIGESDAFPGLELTLRHSHVGETFQVKCESRFAFGHTGRPAYSLAASGNTESTTSDSEKSPKITVPAIPADADLIYEVKVLKHRREGEVSEELEELLKSLLPGVSTTSDEYKEEFNRQSALQEITLRKDCGNRWFSYLDFQRAARAYSKGTQIADNYFKSLPSTTPEGQEPSEEGEKDPVSGKDLAVVHVYVACLNNLSACYLGQGENLKAKDMCVKVLEFDPLNVKALLRAAKASLALHDYLECDLCLKRVLEISPGNTTALSEQVKLRRAEKEYQARSKEMQKNMVKRLFPNKEGATATAAAATPSTGNGSSNPTSPPAAPVASEKGDETPKLAVPTEPAAEKSEVKQREDSPKSNEAADKVKSATPKAVPVDVNSKKPAPATADTDNSGSTAAASTTSAPVYMSMYNASSNIVLLLVTSLIVVLISIYVAYFAKYQQ